eukprot:CAMPEP_0197432308 /NCGR_PEP_ID=MMETSP1175-20131217/387_1 /TAXON_ID=1003142 /ORGANISM="Triceratium dubium, Strain CCMP147" /LENGTH=212 /DNA_ID=CAMNT_0042960341 /DNA_START=214 /DNA_END=855 /DNA_ORIENTATION=+
MSYSYAATAVQTEYPRSAYGDSTTTTNGRYGSQYSAQHENWPTKAMNSYPPTRRRNGSLAFNVNYYLQPKQRLNTLFALHAFFSVVLGAIGYIWPSLATHLFFTTESSREFGVARAILRLFCSLVAAQGVMIWKARAINDGEIKRAFVRAYFGCFLLSSLALIAEHMGNEGVVSGKFFGIVKIVAMVALTVGYGWFTFFQPPTVYALQSHYN